MFRDPHLHSAVQGLFELLALTAVAGLVQWRFTEVVLRYNVNLQKYRFFDFASGVGDTVKQMPRARAFHVDGDEFYFWTCYKYEFLAENEYILDRVVVRLPLSALLDLKTCQKVSTNHDKKTHFFTIPVQKKNQVESTQRHRHKITDKVHMSPVSNLQSHFLSHHFTVHEKN